MLCMIFIKLYISEKKYLHSFQNTPLYLTRSRGYTDVVFFPLNNISIIKVAEWIHYPCIYFPDNSYQQQNLPQSIFLFSEVLDK